MSLLLLLPSSPSEKKRFAISIKFTLKSISRLIRRYQRCWLSFPEGSAKFLSINRHYCVPGTCSAFCSINIEISIWLGVACWSIHGASDVNLLTCPAAGFYGTFHVRAAKKLRQRRRRLSEWILIDVHWQARLNYRNHGPNSSARSRMLALIREFNRPRGSWDQPKSLFGLLMAIWYL